MTGAHGDTVEGRPNRLVLEPLPFLIEPGSVAKRRAIGADLVREGGSVSGMIMR